MKMACGYAVAENKRIIYYGMFVLLSQQHM